MEFTATLIAKIAILLILAIYAIFATVILKQVSLMTKTLEVGFETPIKFVAIVHFLLAIGTFLVALSIL